MYYRNSAPQGRPNFRSNTSSRFGGGGFSRPNSRYARPKVNKLLAKQNEIVAKIKASKAHTELPITVEKQAFVPKHSFADFGLDVRILKNLETKGYINPSSIQDEVLGPVLEGQDVVGIASTGSGKTGGFLLPLIHRTLLGQIKRTLIIAPTRELAQQIHQEGGAFARDLGIGAALVIGGASMQQQRRALAGRPEFVIGTPGRIQDFVMSGVLDLQTFDAFVLDEVDRMLDIGFLETIKFLLSKLPVKRQSLFFSATMNRDAQNILTHFVHSPKYIEVKSAASAPNIAQELIAFKNHGEKLDRLHDILSLAEVKKAIIFGRTKIGVQKLSVQLQERGFASDAIHADKRQSARMRTLADFREGKIQYLLATDVASRGIDVPDVTHVINYDLPENYEDYTHRIGRTGRAQKSGVAISFYQE